MTWFIVKMQSKHDVLLLKLCWVSEGIESVIPFSRLENIYYTEMINSCCKLREASAPKVDGQDT